MRASEIVSETIVGDIRSGPSGPLTPVHRVKNRKHLERIYTATTYKKLRGILADDALYVWDAQYATHRDAENIMGLNGPRMSFEFNPIQIGYDHRDITVAALKEDSLITSLYTPTELAKANYDDIADYIDDDYTGEDWPENITESKNIRITRSVTGHHNGQTDMRMSALSDAGTLGYIDYSIYQGVPHINMIQVHQKRQGIGTELVKELQRDFPGVEIQWGSMSEAGSALYNSLEFDMIPNNRVIRKKRLLDELKKKHDNYMQLHAKWEASAKTEKDRQEFLDATHDWNEIHDQITELETELEGEKEYTKLVKTGQTNLSESTTENMQVLKDCVNTIILAMPNIIPAESNKVVYISKSPAYKDLRAKYKNTKYEYSVSELAELVVALFNTADIVNKDSMGGFTTAPGFPALILAISTFMRSADTVKKSDLLSRRLSDIHAVKTFKAIILHELRHFFQKNQYNHEYFTTKNKENDYNAQATEIDAAWLHHLEDYDPYNYVSASRYANAVMNSFYNYKELSDRQLKHYRRKTINYYLQNTKT